MRARRCFGVILYAKRRLTLVTEAFECMVIQIDVSDLDIIRVQRIGINHKAMVLRRDFDLTCLAIEDRLVGPSMTKFEFERFGPARKRKQLMPQADSEYGLFPKQISDRLNCVSEGFGVAGAIA